MKAGISSLNPYAESYVPLSKRGASDGNKGFKSSGNETTGAKEAASMGTNHWDPTTQGPQSCIVPGTEFSNVYQSKVKYGVPVYPGLSLQNPSESEKAILDEEFDMDLAYLQTLFPGISDESLSDVYFANKGDVDTTVDMLNHLESCSVDSSEKLPDTLDIGDVPDFYCSSELASQKLKNLDVQAGAGASSSGVSASAPVN